jgi:hypothetical protein
VPTRPALDRERGGHPGECAFEHRTHVVAGFGRQHSSAERLSCGRHQIVQSFADSFHGIGIAIPQVGRIHDLTREERHHPAG